MKLESKKYLSDIEYSIGLIEEFLKDYSFTEYQCVTNDWFGVWRYVFAYDANGNKTNDFWYNWDSNSNNWVMYHRHVWEYDANGNETDYKCHFWNSQINDTSRYREVYSYDAYGNQTEHIWDNWDSVTNDWVFGSKWVYYWSELTTSISNNIIDLNYIVYPNPFTDYTTIELSDAVQTQKIELIDIHGRIVRTIDNVNSNSVNIHRDNLPSGIYFIRIHSDDTYVKKVIIK